jgi:hyperosmotically inducible protein
MRYVSRSMSVAVLLAVLLSGCTAITGKTAGRNVDDATITTAVKSKLATDQAASTLTKIDVDTNNGTVSLNGNVEDAAAKQRAAELAQQVEGVNEVINNLQVQASR